MHIGVIGTGYVGLVTGTCFAETGNHVLCMDIDQKKIDQLRNGRIPIFEPGLDLLVDRNTKAGRLTFTTSLQETVQSSDILFLALPTPPGADGSADLSFILKVANDLGPLLNKYTIIVNKSTVPVGTADKVREALLKKADPALFDVVSNPEFLREGMAVEDFLKPDRVVIGTSSTKAREWMNELYQPFVRQGNPVIFMDERSSEMTKYAANSYLAMRISYMNEIANLCEKTGANVDLVRIGMGSDHRIGKKFLFPGVGYGGSCFPKDVSALALTARQHAYDFRILNSVMQINEIQKGILTKKCLRYFGNSVKGKRIAVWGLAFKPNTDDIREAPALTIIEELLQGGATVVAFDPVAMDNVKKLFENRITFGEDEYEILNGSDALIIVTEWSEFRTPDFAEIKRRLKNPVIFDGRNLYDPDKMLKEGFHYESIGRKTVGGK